MKLSSNSQRNNFKILAQNCLKKKKPLGKSIHSDGSTSLSQVSFHNAIHLNINSIGKNIEIDDYIQYSDTYKVAEHFNE